MSQYTRKDVENVFVALTLALPKLPDGDRYALETNSPGDGATRYRMVVVHADTSQSYAFGGSGMFVGAREAVRAFALAANVANAFRKGA